MIDLNRHPENILRFATETTKILRHPLLSRPYFQEFYDIRDALEGRFDTCISLHLFFDPASCDRLRSYTQALIDSARGNPVLQCCRSFGRVAYLKEQFAGIHIFLWRDPISQWFSYQVSDYFDTVSLLVLCAINPPKIIERVKEEISFQRYDLSSFSSAYDKALLYPWDTRQRYFVFYTLWLYHLIENSSICDLDLNIDLLTESVAYREQKLDALPPLSG